MSEDSLKGSKWPNEVVDKHSMTSGSDAVFVHGTLEMKIKSLSHLKPQKCGMGSIIPGFMKIDAKNSSNKRYCSRSLLSRLPNLGGLINPIVEIKTGHPKISQRTSVAKTQNRRNVVSPRFNERFSLPLCENLKNVTVAVFDQKHGKKTFIAEFQLTAEELIRECASRTGLNGRFPLSEQNLRKYRRTDIDRYAGKWIKVRDERRVKYGKRGGNGLGWIDLQIRFTSDTDERYFLDKLSAQVLRAHKFNDSRRSFYFSTDKDSIVKYPKPFTVDACRYIVQQTYFVPRFNEDFVIYLSGHQPGINSVLPQISIDAQKDSYFAVRSCFSDLSKAIKAANHVICISSLVLDVEFKLIQTGLGSAGEPSLGDLLKKKANDDGVLVMILLSANANKKDSSTRTKLNKKTIDYFKKTKVRCIPVCRKRGKYGKNNQFMRDSKLDLSNLDHESGFVVVDSPPIKQVKLIVNKSNRNDPKIFGLSCFLGGLRFHDSEYDDADKNISTTSSSGRTRTPLQNIYVKVTNKSALDCLQVFLEQWIRQKGKLDAFPWTPFNRNFRNSRFLSRFYKKFRNSFAEKQMKKTLEPGLKGLILRRRNRSRELSEELIRKNQKKDDFDADSTEAEDDDDHDSLISEEDDGNDGENSFNTSTCAVQIVRSCDSDTAQMNRRLTFPNVKYENAIKVDNSLEKAAVHLIRTAENFIYLETESLIGSFSEWSSEIGIKESTRLEKNTIPAEIVAKVVSKMKQNARFHVFLVLSVAESRLLDDNSQILKEKRSMQKFTLEFMLRRVHEEAEKLNIIPEHYISVFSLMKTEPSSSSKMNKSAISIRSNALIVDDVSMLVSSGAFEEKTFSGRLNTNLAVVVSDFSDVCNRNIGDESDTSRSYVKAARMTLWAEHLGGGNMVNDLDLKKIEVASDLACIDYLQEMAKESLEFYKSCNESTEIRNERRFPKHLTQFPLRFDHSSNTLHKENIAGTNLTRWF